MVKTLSKFAAVLVLAASAGCAAAPADEPSAPAAEAAFASIDAALSSGHLPPGTAPLEVRATYDAALHTTMIDVTTNHLPVIDLPEGTPQPNPDPHLTDTFIGVKVYLEDGTGRRAIASLSAKDFYEEPKAIGPGGGCIHFSIPRLAVGQKIFVAAVVDLDEDDIGARIATALPLVVTPGTWNGEDFDFGVTEAHQGH